MSLATLIHYSRLYGSNPELVTCGGGNTSMKDGNIMYVKGSGTALKDATEDTFVKMNRDMLLSILTKDYPTGDAEREAQFLADCTGAKMPGEESKRPSVEALLHAMFPQKYVLHLHPCLVNGLTCSVNGKEECVRLFGDKVVWVPICKPGYLLAKHMQKVFESTDKPVETVLLENHGVFFGSDTEEGLAKLLDSMMDTLNRCIKEKPDVESAAAEPGFAQKIKELTGKEFVNFNASPTALKFAKSPEAAKPIMKPFNPDQIVYCGPKVQYAECPNCLKEINANVLILKDVGVYAIGDTQKNADNCLTLVKDAMKLATYAQSFGGEQPLPQALVDFITGWEVESYRKNLSK